MTTKLSFKKLDPRAVLPQYQSADAAGFDFHCIESVTLRRGEVVLVRTGLAAEVPSGYEMQVRARSGLAAKHGVFLVNGVGTIDADYRGEIKIILSTCLEEPVFLRPGDRIAQGVLSKIDRALVFEAAELSSTERGAGGFGSTGVRPS